MSEFEAGYLARLNRIGFGFFALHVPVFMLVAYFNGTGPLLAFELTALVLLGPVLALKLFQNPRHVSLVYGFTAMIMGGLLVHFGQGDVQIEMHFYFFALLAMLAVFGNPMAIVVATLTVALHHGLTWLLLPSSVFNYDAPLWVVAVHVAFVLLEAIATCFIARSFFDNVIELERIVQSRTIEVGQRNRDLQLVLDNVDQGFLTIDRELRMSRERSRVVDHWLGTPLPGETFTDYVAKSAPEFASRFAFAFGEVVEGTMPIEVTLDQLPKYFVTASQEFRVECKPVLRGDELDKAVLVITDVTVEMQHVRADLAQRDVLSILSCLSRDKSGVLEFFEEARGLVATIDEADDDELTELRRALHTLKGNCMLFGVQTIADLCHKLETQIDEQERAPTREQRSTLKQRWAALCENMETLFGEQSRRKIEIDDGEYEAILRAVLQGAPHAQVARMIEAWKLEPTRARLTRVGEQAKGIAKRLNKGSIDVGIQDHELLLDPEEWAPFWASFVHVVRNAIDHGLEEPEQRSALGKRRRGSIQLATRIDGDDFLIEVRDDGRGVDWEAVAEKAKTRGIPAETRDDLVQALFADGVSTKSEVSAYSGRGVGMSAVRSAAEQRGGKITVTSEDGGGTRVEFRFPRGSVAEADVHAAPRPAGV